MQCGTHKEQFLPFRGHLVSYIVYVNILKAVLYLAASESTHFLLHLAERRIRRVKFLVW